MIEEVLPTLYRDLLTQLVSQGVDHERVTPALPTEGETKPKWKSLLGPLYRTHLINSNIFILVCNTPVLSNLSKLKLNQVVILINQNIHVGFQTGWCIYSTRLKSQLYVVVWVGTNYKVNVVPVSKKTSFDVANSIR